MYYVHVITTCILQHYICESRGGRARGRDRAKVPGSGLGPGRFIPSGHGSGALASVSGPGRAGLGAGKFGAGLGAAPFGPGLFEIMHLGKVKLWGQIRGRAVWDHITCFG